MLLTVHCRRIPLSIYIIRYVWVPNIARICEFSDNISIYRHSKKKYKKLPTKTIWLIIFFLVLNKLKILICKAIIYIFFSFLEKYGFFYSSYTYFIK